MVGTYIALTEVGKKSFSSQQDDIYIEIPDEQVVAPKDGQIAKDGNW